MVTKKQNEPAVNEAAPTPAVKEEQPQRGGSYTRNDDGSLTQTEGQDVAAMNKQTSQEQ